MKSAKTAHVIPKENREFPEYQAANSSVSITNRKTLCAFNPIYYFRFQIPVKEKGGTLACRLSFPRSAPAMPEPCLRDPDNQDPPPDALAR